MNMKRIIAREGLIIIAICLLLVIALYLNKRENSKKFDYEKKAEIVEIVDVIHPAPKKQTTSDSTEAEGPWKDYQPTFKETFDDLIALDPNFQKSTGLYIMVQKPTDLIKMIATIKKDFPKLNNPSFVASDKLSWQVTIDRYYDDQGNSIKFKNYGAILFAIILLYPAYLIVRFIIWAIKTLKQ